MKLSIIVPVFNVEKYIHQCINSIIYQNYKNLEIILVNDGSTDKCSQICDEFALADNRIKVINQQNKGLSSARNTGLANATGSYVWFIDSDDWIENNTIEILMHELKIEKLEMLAFSMQLFIEKNNTFEQLGFENFNIPTTSSGNLFLINNKRFAPQAWIYLYEKSFLDKNHLLFKEGLIHEDEYFNWNCFIKVKKIKKIKTIVYNYRIRESSITNSGISQQKIDSHLFLLKFLIELKIKNFFESKFLDYSIVKYINQIINLLINSNKSFKYCKNIIHKVKSYIPNIEIYQKDSKVQKIEKIIYNNNVILFYFYKLFRNKINYYLQMMKSVAK